MCDFSTQFLFFHDSICSTQFDSFYNPIFLAQLSSEEDSFELERQARLEIRALRQVRHENVICLLEGETGEEDPSIFFNNGTNNNHADEDDRNASPPHLYKYAPSRFNMFSYLLTPLYDINLEDYISRDGPLLGRSSSGDGDGYISSSTASILSQLLEGICSGTAAIHAAGMRHNHICPSNVLLRFRDSCSKKRVKKWSNGNILYDEDDVMIIPRPVLCDFGSVSPVTVEVSSKWQASELADFHRKISTPAYRAPEIWRILSPQRSFHCLDGPTLHTSKGSAGQR